MQFRYGPFRSQEADNFRYKGGSMVGRRNQAGRLDAIIVTMDFEFTIVADGQLALNNRMRTIQDGIRYDGYDVGMWLDNGQPSRIFLRSAETSSGVRVTRWPFPEPEIEGADYATSLKGSCSFSAEYLPSQWLGTGGGNDGALLVAYRESVTVNGNGGPRTVIQEYDEGPPETFTVADKTKVTMTQEGAATFEAKAPNVFPQVNRPLFPNLLVNESQSVRKDTSQMSDSRWSSSISWSYQFQSTGPIEANPNAR